MAAKSSYDFINSIGVNTHFGFDYSNYHTHWEDICFPGLLKLGVKHIRDGNYYSPGAERHYLEVGRRTNEIALYKPNDSPVPYKSVSDQHELTFDLDERLLLIRIQR